MSHPYVIYVIYVNIHRYIHPWRSSPQVFSLPQHLALLADHERGDEHPREQHLR